MDFMSSLRTTGPAWKSVWISSPVRSRKPVLTKITRSAAAAMQASRLSDVRFSSSMIPILRVRGGQAERLLDGGEQLDGERDLVRAVLLGLDDVDAAGARVGVPAAAAQVVQRRGGGDQRVEHALRDSVAVGGATASVVMWWPQLRTSSSERPGSTSSEPSGAV